MTLGNLCCLVQKTTPSIFVVKCRKLMFEVDYGALQKGFHQIFCGKDVRQSKNEFA